MNNHLTRSLLLSFYTLLLSYTWINFYYNVVLTINVCSTENKLTVDNLIIFIISLVFFYYVFAFGFNIGIKYNTLKELLIGLVINTMIYSYVLIFYYYLHDVIVSNSTHLLANTINSDCMKMTYLNTKTIIFSLISTIYIRDMMLIICLSFGY